MSTEAMTNPSTGPEQHTVRLALGLYDADLTDDNHIQKVGKEATSVRVVFGQRGRISFVGPGNLILQTGAATQAAVSDFVEKFWFWEKVQS